jgi:hypothetical protein
MFSFCTVHSELPCIIDACTLNITSKQFESAPCLDRLLTELSRLTNYTINGQSEFTLVFPHSLFPQT